MNAIFTLIIVATLCIVGMVTVGNITPDQFDAEELYREAHKRAIAQVVCAGSGEKCGRCHR